MREPGDSAPASRGNVSLRSGSAPHVLKLHFQQLKAAREHAPGTRGSPLVAFPLPWKAQEELEFLLCPAGAAAQLCFLLIPHVLSSRSPHHGSTTKRVLEVIPALQNALVKLLGSRWGF